MTTHFRLTLLALTLLAPSLHSQETPASLLKRDLYFLAGEECEGRGLKTKGIHKAADYIAAEFKAAKLKSPFPDGSYFQPFSLKENYLEAGPNKLILTDADGKQVEAELNKQFTVSALSGKSSVKGKLVFAGYGITSEKYDDYKGLDVKNRVVVLFRRTPRFSAKENPLFTREESFKHALFTEKIKLAEKNGAAAVILVNNLDLAGKDDPLMPFADLGDGKIGSLPVIHARRAFIDQTLSSSGLTLASLESAIDKDLEPRSKELTGWSANVQTSVALRELAPKNVVGFLEGIGPLAGETVVIGAHYDHLGWGGPGSLSPWVTEIHYGADDNASGVTALMELARRFSARKDRTGRRIVFISFSAEERDRLGSRHYCDKPPFPMKDTVAMLNMDMVGRLRPDSRTGKDRLTVGGVGTAKNFEKLLDDANQKHGFHLDKVQRGTGTSDHTPFYLAKVPVYHFFTGTHPEYHRPADRPATVNLEGVLKITDLVDDLTTTLASAKERPEYVAGAGSSILEGPSFPNLGVIPQKNDAETQGMEVGGIVPGSAAEVAGIRKGDRITAIGGKPVKNVQDYTRVVSGLRRGEEVEITVEREGKPLKLKATPK